jgi:hypothetical protein
MSQALYNKQTKTMTEQQFDEIVGAILAGKYSWACVLILQTAGYNPLHYIPYRTYNRLIKDNRLNKDAKKENCDNYDSENREKLTIQSNKISSHKRSSKIQDLTHLEELKTQPDKVRGGFRVSGWQYFIPIP